MSETVNKTAKTSSSIVTFGEKKVERRLSMKPNPVIGNLCLAILTDVKIEQHEAPKTNPETGIENLWDFAGYTIPTMVLTFKQVPTKEDPYDRYYEHRFKVVPNLDKNGAPIDKKIVISLYQQYFSQLQHICNAYEGVPGFSDNEEVPGIDPEANVEVRIKQFNAFFEHFLNVLTGNGDKPVYKDVKVYLKLIADYRTRKFLTLPTFVGRGFIQRVLPGANPKIALEPNETVVLAAGKTQSKTENAIASAAPMSENTELDPEIAAILASHQG